MWNALNLLMSGQYIWDNKDWTKIKMGKKGTPEADEYMQIDKAMMEVPNMIRQPKQEAFNKLNFFPSEVANQVFGTEYINPRIDKRTGMSIAGPPMQGNPIEHFFGQMVPFAAQPSPVVHGPVQEILSRSGLVQYSGSTPESRKEQNAADKERRKKLKAHQ